MRVSHRICRHSLVSSADYHPQAQYDTASTMDSTYGAAPRRQDPNQLLMLPAPLAVQRMSPTGASASSGGVSRSSEEGGYGSDIGSSAHQRLIPSPQDGAYVYGDDYESPQPTQAQYMPQNSQFEARVSRTVSANNGVLRQSSNQYTVETQSPFNPYTYAQAQYTGYDEPQQQPQYVAEPEEYPQPAPVMQQPQAAAARSRASRGVSLADNGPVPGPGGVRRVSRQPNNRRPTSQAPPQNRYSRNSQTQFSLPPGAGAPGSGQGGYAY